MLFHSIYSTQSTSFQPCTVLPVRLLVPIINSALQLIKPVHSCPQLPTTALFLTAYSSPTSPHPQTIASSARAIVDYHAPNPSLSSSPLCWCAHPFEVPNPYPYRLHLRLYPSSHTLHTRQLSILVYVVPLKALSTFHESPFDSHSHLRNKLQYAFSLFDTPSVSSIPSLDTFCNLSYFCTRTSRVHQSI